MRSPSPSLSTLPVRAAVAFAVVLATVAACGDAEDVASGQGADAGAEAGAGGEGGGGQEQAQRPDGGAGVCCPASLGGCAFVGGYSASGTCPDRPDLCDNLGGYRIEKDAYGCDAVVYRPGGGGPVAQDASADAP